MSRPTEGRRVDLDITRAVALVGVCVMNYYGYMVLRGADRRSDFLGRVFDPWKGPLSTRFAATFVMVAGMGVALLAKRAHGDAAEASRVRWVLVRRGVLLFTFGYFFNWVWPGTILLYYGALFVVAAAVLTLHDRWLLAIGVGAAVAAAGLRWWALDRSGRGLPNRWMTRPDAGATTSPWDLLVDVTARGTHPLLPWLLFFCVGIVLGRRLPLDGVARARLAFTGVLCAAGGYLLEGVLPWADVLRSVTPYDRGLLYSLTTLGVAMTAVAVVGAVADATASRPAARMLAVAGRTTLTLYVLHALVFLLLVDWLEWVPADGLTTALVLSAGFWLLAVAAANVWATRRGTGPLEWVYRRFSDGR